MPALIWQMSCKNILANLLAQVREEDHVMTGSAQSTSHASVGCSICAALVPLETSKTDEDGKAVHEDCYVRQTISRFRLASPVHPRENRLNSILLPFPL